MPGVLFTPCLLSPLNNFLRLGLLHLTTWSNVGRVVGRRGSMGDRLKDSLFPRVGVAGVVWQRWGGTGGGVFHGAKQDVFAKLRFFLFGAFQKSHLYIILVSKIMFQKICSIEQSDILWLKTKNSTPHEQQKGKSGREAERFLEPLPIGPLDGMEQRNG